MGAKVRKPPEPCKSFLISMSQQIVLIKEYETLINTAIPVKTSYKLKSCPNFL